VRKNDSTLTTETALIFDAVHLFAKALHQLDKWQVARVFVCPERCSFVQVIKTHPLSCDGEETWDHGNSLVNLMKLEEMEGLTGKIQFDQQGLRVGFQLDVVELKKEGLTKVGVWTEAGGLNFTRNFTETYTEIVESLQNKTLIVTTIRSPPYSMVTQSERRVSGNEAFEGFAIDLIEEIAHILKFNYSFKWVDDGAYGFRNKETGEWNGLMGELLAQTADLAITDRTITYEREQAVDFSMPFMNLGISILYKKPLKKPPDLFSFLSPLSLDVWIYTAVAYFGVSILLFILARFSPYEWDNPHPCTEEAEVLVNEFSLCNSMWFTIGSLMQQGSDISPKAISTRMVAGMWWFFTLIMISSYTANLAAFLTVERMESPIESAEDLAKQTKIKYGCLESGSTRAFFRDSKLPTYSRMASFMESQKSPKVFTGSNNEGVQRVLDSPGNYAFLMESNSISYQTERNCELTQIGGLLDSKGYGIAFTPGSPYRIPISSAILQLQEKGRLHVLKERWWKERRGGGQCPDELKKMANELSLDNVGGIFVVLLAGMGVACAISIGEFIWKSRQLERKVNVRHSDLVRMAIAQTNTNMFYIKRAGADGVRGSIHTKHPDHKDPDWTVQSPEYHLVGPGQRLLLRTQPAAAPEPQDSLCPGPDIAVTRRGDPGPRLRGSRGSTIAELAAADPYGPIAEHHLRSELSLSGDSVTLPDSQEGEEAAGGRAGGRVSQVACHTSLCQLSWD
jgi:ABC-type amino acid transport substrate-binding protein